jgi:hypothetical protein
VVRFTKELLEKSRSRVEILQRLNIAESEAAAKARNEATTLQKRPARGYDAILAS